MDPRQAPTSARQPTRLAFHASRIVIDIGVLLVLGAMSLPFVTSGQDDLSAMTADAFPALLLVIPIFVITLLPDHTRPLPTPLGWPAMVLALAAFPYAIVKFLDAATIADTMGGEVATGARILVFGTFVTVAGLAIGLARTLLRLPSGGTYPARPDPDRTRAGSRPSPTASGTAGQTTPSPAAAPATTAGPRPAAARPQIGSPPEHAALPEPESPPDELPAADPSRRPGTAGLAAPTDAGR